MSITQVILVAGGGAIGAVIRYIFSGLTSDGIIPWGTLTANVIACFVLGVVLTRGMSSPNHQAVYLLVAVGFCGGLSTFSTFIFELFSYYSKAELAQGLLYLSASILSGSLAFLMGNQTSKLF